MSVVDPEVTIVVFAPAFPGVPAFVTPVVYSLLPELSEVAENCRICPEFVESDWSKIYVSPSLKLNYVVGPEASIKNLDDAIVTEYVIVLISKTRCHIKKSEVLLRL